MPTFKYTVANTQGKKLSGSIEAPNESLAREELNGLGFSILEIKELSQEDKPLQQKSDNQIKYVFEARNTQGQNILGTISSLSELLAYKRLRDEYSLNVTSIWVEGASDEQIQQARIKGTLILEQTLSNEKSPDLSLKSDISPADLKQGLIVQTKVENVLSQVNTLLKTYENEIPPDRKQEINRKIDKLLRIKSSTNLSYIIETTEDLLKYIQEQETSLKEKGYIEKRADLKVQVKNLLSRLHDTGKPKTLSEDIVQNIRNWQNKYVSKATKLPWYTRFINDIFTKLQKTFETPEEIRILKLQIKTYNSQLIEYLKIYFKEPTKEYKEKVKQALKTIWQIRKKTTKELKETKIRLKEEARQAKKASAPQTEAKHEFFKKVWEELNEFTGWLLTFYLIYYFVSIYLSSKDFGLKGVSFYDTKIFKYAIASIFLVHIAFTLKVNFFPKNRIASAIILPSMVLSIVFTIANF